METGAIETFGSHILADVQFNQDGSLKASGKQNIKFFHKKRLAFRAVKDEHGQCVNDPKTGIPKKEAYEESVEMIRVETKGDTNIFEDVANELHKRQFYRQYKFFREGKIPDGNPIEDFEFLQGPMVMELHMLGIHTIQQVATMSDLECEQLKDQPGYEMRDIAAQWVRINTPQGQSLKAQALEREVLKLKREMESMRGQRRELPAEEPKPGTSGEAPIEEPSPAMETMELTPEQMTRRGRPRKVQ